MANEIRSKTNLVSGTLSVALASGDTTMSSAGLANLAVIDTTNHAAIICENEIFYVTAHTASATTATILRAQEGTSAAAHAQNVAWVHGPTTLDNPGNTAGAWLSWTPTFANMTLGNGTITAAYIQFDKTVHYRFKFVLGSTSTVGTSPTFTFPVTASSNYVASVDLMGYGTLSHSGSADYFGAVRSASSTTGLIISTGVSGANTIHSGVTATAPFTWATGDRIGMYGTYEAA